MIKLLTWLLWPQPKLDAEFDFSGNDVYGIDRHGDETCISYHFNGSREDWFCICPIAVHNRMIKQFRQKLELQKSDKESK